MNVRETAAGGYFAWAIDPRQHFWRQFDHPFCLQSLFGDTALAFGRREPE